MKKQTKTIMWILIGILALFAFHVVKEKIDPSNSKNSTIKTQSSLNLENKNFDYGYVPTDPTENYYYIKNNFNLPKCGNRTNFFTYPFIPLSETNLISPMGWVGASSGHLSPSPAILFKLYENNSADPEFIAPGNMTITSISEGSHGGDRYFWSYDITFYICEDVKLTIGHISDLEPKFKELLKNADCAKHQPGENEVCTVSVNIPVQTGEKIGKVDRQYGPEIIMVDFRTNKTNYANPDRWYKEQFHYVCMFDYYQDDLKKTFLKKINVADKKIASEPLCGTVEQDTYGTAQGVWFLKDDDGKYASPEHITLSYQNSDQNRGQFTISTSILNVDVEGYLFEYKEGLTNTNFKKVIPGKTHCYETESSKNSPEEETYKTIFLIKLSDADNLLLEKVNLKKCNDSSWEFSNPIKFER